jgi:invasion protein IalB
LLRLRCDKPQARGSAQSARIGPDSAALPGRRNLTLRVGHVPETAQLKLTQRFAHQAGPDWAKRNATMGHFRVPALALAALVALAGTAAAQGVVKSVHGDWQIRCDTPPGAQTEQCALIQSVTAEDRPNVGLTVIVLKTADQKFRLMRVLAPLGVLLPNGLGLRIDAADVGKVSFVRCLPNGCVAEVVVNDDLMNKLRTGQNATFIIFQTPEEGIGIPVSLKGFGDGFDKLP